MSVILNPLLVPGWANETMEAPVFTYDFSLHCHTTDPDIYFSEHQSELEMAKAICRPCPLKAECLSGAISRAEPCGVWGGEIFDRGVVVASKRMPGRPRLNPAAA